MQCIPWVPLFIWAQRDCKGKFFVVLTITEIKNTLKGIKSRKSETEECLSELEDKMLEITSEEQDKVKRMKKKWG